MERRALHTGPLSGVMAQMPTLPATESPAAESARRAIVECVRASCEAPLSDALAIQAKHSAEFMRSPACKKGRVGSEFTKTMKV
jgi:hypothetical protein